MYKDNIIELKKPEQFVDDPITNVLRTGAKKLLAEALEVEIEDYISLYKDLKDNQDRRKSGSEWLSS
jgi:putative transposase